MGEHVKQWQQSGQTGLGDKATITQSNWAQVGMTGKTITQRRRACRHHQVWQQNKQEAVAEQTKSSLFGRLLGRQSGFSHARNTKNGRIYGSSAEEEAWSHFLHGEKKSTNKQHWTAKTSAEMGKGKQMKKVIPEAVYNSVIEETLQENSGAGLSALHCTATSVPANTDRAIWNLLHFCDGSGCEKKVLTKKRGHRASARAKRRTKDYNKFVSRCIGFFSHI